MTPREINAAARVLELQAEAEARFPLYLVAVISFALGVLVMGTAQDWRDTRALEFARSMDWRRTCADLGYSGFTAGQSDGGTWELKCVDDVLMAERGRK